MKKAIKEGISLKEYKELKLRLENGARIMTSPYILFLLKQ